MKLDTWELISSIIEAGGVFEAGAYRLRNSSGQLHRDDGPAAIYTNGGQAWYRNGQFHRDDGPAVIYPDGKQYWYRNGQLHRDDGPAVVYPDGAQYWYRNGYAIPAPPGPKAGPARSSSSTPVPLRVTRGDNRL